MPSSALTFSICDVRLGLDVPHVQEVLPCVKLIHPPETPPLLRGFVNVEKKLIPVLRLESLLQLDLGDAKWDPERKLSALLIVARVDGLTLAWMVDEGVELLRYKSSDTVRLPAGHVLNNCAELVIPQPPPAMSIVLLNPRKLLLESEKIRVAQLLQRETERHMMAMDVPETSAIA